MEKGLIKITGFIKQVWQDGSPTNRTRVRSLYINPTFIVSVEDTELPELSNSFIKISEQKGCLITVSKGAISETYEHNKSAEHFYEAIRSLYRMAL